MIEFKNVSKVYDNGSVALDDVCLTINDGEFLTILGPSGCGKTTALRLIAGFEDLTEGSIILDGQDVSNIPAEQRPVNTVFQSYALFPHMTIFENVAFGLRMQKVPSTEIEPRVMEALRMVRLEDRAQQKPAQLSGGQQQRVAIARALVSSAPVILADEPTGNLDENTASEIIEILKKLAKERNKCVIVVTHSKEVARAADTVFELKNKKLINKRG